MASKTIRIAVMGTGAVGGYFGSRLAAAGREVAFVVRAKHLDAMRQDGLKVKSIHGNLHVRSYFTADLAEIGPVDLILFCVKSYDTEDAAAKLTPLVGEKTFILSLQNGVDNPDKIGALWGKARTLGAVVYIGALVSAPGVIDHSAGGRIVQGAMDGVESEAAEFVRQIFSDAQVPCAVSREIRKVMWTKLVWNAPFCALSCLARATVKEIMESEPLRELALKSMDEVREAAKCQGIDLGRSAVDEAMEISRTIGDFKPSMLQDLEAGKPLEYEALNGVIVSLLNRKGKRAPVNETFYSVLRFLDQRNRSLRPD